MIINLKNVSKKYKSKEERALDSIDAQFNKGKIYFILGKNGSGKTTLLKLIMGFIFPTNGEISVFQNKPVTGNKKIGYLPENISLYPHLDAYEHIYFTALMLNSKIDKKKINNILSTLNLDKQRGKSISNFSLGMKRRLQLALSVLIKKRELLILDEPTNGLDVEGLMWLKKELLSQRERGCTILMASHSVKELEDIIDEYFIIDEGKVILNDSYDQEKQSLMDIYKMLISEGGDINIDSNN